MTLTPTVTKAGVSKDGAVYTVSFRLQLNNGTDDVIDKVYSANYISGSAITPILNTVKTEMQSDIDAYIAEQAIYDATAYTNGCTTIQNALTTE